MKTLTVHGDPHSITSMMVDKSELFHDHETVIIESSDGNKTVRKKIFRIIDAGEDKWELQFE